mmetsp:Transcript_78799/g.225584  ORF Transcript_78799/g.225584 Transcript_78799/m.225584 type:complete len:292 (-) Transcript_78799:71-946(-)
MSSRRQVERVSVLKVRHGRLLHRAGLGLDHLVDDAVVHRLLRRHEKVAITVLLDLLDGLASVVGDERVEARADVQDLLSLDLDVCGLALRATKRLVDHDARVRQRPTLARGTGAEEESAHARGAAEAYSRHVARDILHGVVDGHARRDGAARRVDVKGDVLRRVLVGEVEELGHKHVRALVVHLRAEEEDAVLKKARDHVHLPVASVDDRHAHRRHRALSRVLAARVDLRVRLAHRDRSNSGALRGADGHSPHRHSALEGRRRADQRRRAQESEESHGLQADQLCGGAALA